jgi:hypothetical protein
METLLHCFSLCIRQRQVFSVRIPAALTTEEEQLGNQEAGGLSGAQSQSAHNDKEKNSAPTSNQPPILWSSSPYSSQYIN